MTPAPEFHRPERLDTIGAGERTVDVAATADERVALAKRFALESIERLDARLTLRRDAGAIRVDGEVTAALVQPCAATGEPLPVTIAEAVALRFVEPGTFGHEEVELDAEAIDTIELEGAAIDLGEVAAETLALAIDPFLRGVDADAALAEAGVLGESEAGPFAALSALKDKLTR